MTVDDLAKQIEEQAKELGIKLDKVIAVDGDRNIDLRSKRAPNVTKLDPQVRVECAGHMARGKFTMTVEHAESLDEEELEREIRLGLQDAAWEANPTR